MCPSQIDIVTPMTWQPFSLSKRAVNVESTPPDIPTTTVEFGGGSSDGMYFM